MYFIPALRFAFLERSDVAITLGYINVAVRYRQIFIDPAGPLAVLDYYRSFEFDELKSKVRRSMRELLIIEDEARILKLDQRPSIAVYYGPSIDDAKMVGTMQKDWEKIRKDLQVVSQRLLRTPLTAEENQKKDVLDVWVETLTAFVRVSDQINSDTLHRAIDNLKLYLFGTGKSP